uniref:Uncharacterized protein n=1 Tax=viral metagenome TaxID=1070528 RepID=A0A6C0EK06_9ZZZZ
MSCGQREFPTLNQTWSRQTSLNPVNWEPNPELAANSGCYAGGPAKYPGVTEMFTDSCGAYATNSTSYTGMQNIGPHATQIVNFKEGFSIVQYNRYNKLGNTWKSQKPYSL